MKVTKGCGEYGIIETMIKDGYSDLVFIAEKEEIPSISLFMCHSNERLRRIIQDPKAESKITLPDQITKRAFLLLSCYYGYGTIEIDEENVCELLKCCICLDEQKMMNICLRYIKTHPSKNLVINILNMLYLIPKNYMDDIELSLKDFIQINCCEILNDEMILKSLLINDLKFIISIDNLLVPNEKYLLDKILNHYKNHNEKRRNNEISQSKEKNEYDETMKLLNWKEINIGDINPDDMELIDLNMMYKRKNENEIKNRIYSEEPKTGNDILNRIIRRGIRELSLMKDEIEEQKPVIQQPPPPNPFIQVQQIPIPQQPVQDYQYVTCFQQQRYSNYIPPSNQIIVADDDQYNGIDIFENDESNIRQIIHLDLSSMLLEEVKRTKSAIEILVIYKLSQKIKTQVYEKLTKEDRIRIIDLIKEKYRSKNINNNRMIELSSYFSKLNEDIDILYKMNGSEILVQLLNSKYIKNKSLITNYISSNISNPNSILNQINNR